MKSLPIPFGKKRSELWKQCQIAPFVPMNTEPMNASGAFSRWYFFSNSRRAGGKLRSVRFLRML